MHAFKTGILFLLTVGSNINDIYFKGLIKYPVNKTAKNPII